MCGGGDRASCQHLLHTHMRLAHLLIMLRTVLCLQCDVLTTLMRFEFWGCCVFVVARLIFYFLCLKWTTTRLSGYMPPTPTTSLPPTSLKHSSLRFVLIQSIVHTCNRMIGGFLLSIPSLFFFFVVVYFYRVCMPHT